MGLGLMTSQRPILWSKFKLWKFVYTLLQMQKYGKTPIPKKIKWKEITDMQNNKVEYLINMINDMDIKDKLRLAICMSQSKWSGLIYNTKESYEKFDNMLKKLMKNIEQHL